LEFLVHAVPYIAPGSIGRVSRGIPTAHCGPDLSEKINSDPHEAYILEHPDGRMRGQSVSPVYRTAAHAACQDREVHILLALVDALRVGKAREKVLARKLLEDQI
jgi:hypothetical protein